MSNLTFQDAIDMVMMEKCRVEYKILGYPRIEDAPEPLVESYNIIYDLLKEMYAKRNIKTDRLWKKGEVVTFKQQGKIIESEILRVDFEAETVILFDFENILHHSILWSEIISIRDKELK